MKRWLLVSLFSLSAYAQIPNGAQQTYGTTQGVHWQAKSVIDVRDYGATGDAQVAADCYMTSGSAVLNCATNHFTAADVGKVIAVYENGPTASGFIQPLSTTILSYQSAGQVTLNANASNSTTSTVSAISSAARGVFTVTVNTSAPHNLSVGQMACIPAGIDPTIVGCFVVLTVPSGTQFTFNQWQQLVNPTISVTSGTVTGYSSRVVWGTNNDTKLQAATDACGDQGGCTLLIPKGHYLTHGLNLQCSVLGNWTGVSLGTCTHVYNNITVQGDGIDVTELENWDAATTIGANPAHNLAVISAGIQAEQYPYRYNPTGPKLPVTGLTFKGMTLHQVKYATQGIKGMRLDNTNGVIIDHIKVINWSYEGFYLSGIHYDIHDSQAYQVGLAGPAGLTTTSAINSIGAWGIVHDNYVVNSGQCIEGGSPHVEMWHNNCDGTGQNIYPQVSPHLGMNVTSNTYGTWDIHVHDNYFTGWTGEQFLNVLGKMKNVSFNNNFIKDDTNGLTLGSGKEVNNVNIWPEEDTVPHGSSTCSNNTFVVTPNGRPASYFFRVGDGTNPMLENWTCDGNNITYTTMFCPNSPFEPAQSSAACSGGGTATIPNGIINVGSTGAFIWAANHAYALGSFMQPTNTTTGKFIYKATVGGTSDPTTEPTECVVQGCTFTDGSVTWALYSFRPQVRFSNTTIHAPTNALPYGQSQQEINSAAGVVNTGQVYITGWNYNLATRRIADGVAIVTPAASIYSDFALNTSLPITSNVATGTAPFSIASTTTVPNLHASNSEQLLGSTWTAPGNIGSITPAPGRFTTIQSNIFNATTNSISMTAPFQTFSGVDEVQQNVVGAGANPKAGALSYWKFDENAGTTAADVVGGTTLTVASPGVADWTTGIINSAVNINAADALVAPSFPSTGTQDWNNGFSISAWINPANLTGTQVIFNVTTSGNLEQIRFQLSGNKLQTIVWILGPVGGQAIITTSSGTISSGVWTFVTGTFSGTTVKQYINGTVDSTVGTVNGTIDVQPDHIAVGRRANPNVDSFFSGAIDEVGVYNRFLSPAEVSLVYNGGTGIQYPFTSTTQTADIQAWQCSLGTTCDSITGAGVFKSVVVTGTAPFDIASTTNVPNLNASSLNGDTFASPGTIGSGTPGAANFTTVGASSTITGLNFIATSNAWTAGTIALAGDLVCPSGTTTASDCTTSATNYVGVALATTGTIYPQTSGFATMNYDGTVSPSPGWFACVSAITAGKVLAQAAACPGGQNQVGILSAGGVNVTSGSVWLTVTGGGGGGGGGGIGTVTSVATASPLTGGPITGVGTVSCPTCAVGPGSSTASHVAIFSGTDGLTLADGGTLAGTVTHSVGSLTANLPVFGNGAGDTIIGTKTGNTTQLATWLGAVTAARCVDTDANGNLQIAAADCNAFTGTVTHTGSALTLGLPVVGNGAADTTIGTKTGNTTQFATWNGVTTAARCVDTDANGNLQVTSADCGTSAGTVTHTLGALTLGLPMIGNGLGDSNVGTKTGNTTLFPTWTGAATASRCVHTDANGNLTITTADCSVGGSGTVTNTLGALTANAVMLGNGAADSKVLTGITTNGNSTLNLGRVGASGSSCLLGSTSGTACLTAAPAQGTPNAIYLPLASGVANSLLSNNGANPQQTSWTLTLAGLTSVTSTTVNSSGGALNGSLGATTPSTVAATTLVAQGATVSGPPGIATGTASNTDLAGQLTLSGGTKTYTFVGTYVSAPICVATDVTAVNAVQVSATTTVLTINGTSSDVVNFICVGRN